jgi:hypothetical protein
VKDHPTVADVEDWVLFWRDRLGLRDWTIRLHFPKKQDERTEGLISWSQGYCTATLKLWPCFFKEERVFAFKIVLHELLHLPFAHLQDEMCAHVGEGIVFETFKRQLERAVDRLASALAFVTPLPEKEGD